MAGRLSKQNRNPRGKLKEGWNFIDDYTGFIENSKDAVIDWRGFVTTAKTLDIRHPQELPPPTISGESQIPWSRPESDPTFVDDTVHDEDTGY